VAISLPRSVFPISNSASLSFTIGALIGLIGATKGVGPIGILLISLIYFWKERNRARLMFSVPLFQYLLVQFTLTWWHSGDPFAIEIQSYYVLIFLSIPIVHFFTRDFEYDEKYFVWGVLAGLSLSTILLAIDYFSAWNNSRSCRAKAFQSNPLRTAIHMVPLAGILIMINAQKGKFGWLSVGLVVLMLFVSGNLVGARMTFYSVFGVIALLCVNFLYLRQTSNFVKVLMSAIFGLFFVIVFDDVTGCNFSKRLTNNFSNISDTISDAPKSNVNSEVLLAPTVKNEEPIYEKPKEKRQRKAKVVDINETSEGIRARLWEKAVTSFLSHPLLGQGADKENDVVNLGDRKSPRGGVSHNQYLSWAVWGGLVSIVSGFILFSTHFLTTCNRLAALVFIVPWAISSLSLSTFALGGAIAEYMVTLIVLLPLLGIKNNNWTFCWPRVKV
jgi:hypothetical protein